MRINASLGYACSPIFLSLFILFLSFSLVKATSNFCTDTLASPTITKSNISQGFTQLEVTGYGPNVTYAWKLDTGILSSGDGTSKIIVFSFSEFEACLTVSNTCDTVSTCKVFEPELNHSGPCGIPSDNLNTCVMCGPIYIGNSDGYTADTFDYDFPCGVIENSQWIRFIAGSTNLGAILLSSNCTNNNGLEIAFYDQSLNLIGDCLKDSVPNDTLYLNTPGATPGEIYYIMIDGVNGDVCDFVLTVLGGVTVCPIDPPGPISTSNNSQSFCSGDTVEYSIAPLQHAIWYDWEIPSFGEIISGDKTNAITVKWKEPGIGRIGVFPRDFCFPGTPSFKSIQITGPEPTRLHFSSCDTSYISDEIFTAASGCDSIVRSYFGNPDVGIDINPNICNNDTFLLTYKGYPSPTSDYTWLIKGPSSVDTFLGQGPFPVLLADTVDYTFYLILEEDGCVDTVDIQMVKSNAPPPAPVVNCSASLTSIELEWNGSTGTRYSVFIDSNIVKYRSPNPGAFLPNLSPDSSYTFRVVAHSEFGCGDSETFLTCSTLSCGPPPVTYTTLSLCDNAEAILLDTTYGCSWYGPGVDLDSCTIHPEQLSAGIETITYDFSVGPCDYEVSRLVQVKESPKMVSEITSSVFIGKKGAIDLSIDNSNGSENILWSDGSQTTSREELNPGLYCVSVNRDNGCSFDSCFTVKPAEYTVPSLVLACANKPKNIMIRPTTGIAVEWFPSTGMSCNDCTSPTVQVSTSSIYTIIGQTDDGRRDTTSILVLVLPDILCGILKEAPDRRTLEDWIGIPLDDLSENEILSIFERLRATDNTIKVYPNPTSGNIWVESQFDIQEIAIFNALGKLALNISAGSDSLEADLSDLPSGLYRLRIETANGVFFKNLLLESH